MRHKLYPNMKRMTTLFCLAIICVTLTTLTLRLVVLSDLASAPPGGNAAQVESDLFDYVIARRVNFASPGAPGDFRIENPETNEYYMSVEIIFPETGHVVFYTGLIRPGEVRRQFVLHRQLPPGTHECIARISAHDPITLEKRGSEEQEIILHIG